MENINETYTIESTIKKLNENHLMELTSLDYEFIADNSELKQLFFAKIKQGYEFDMDAANLLAEELLKDPEIVILFLETFKKQSLYDYINLFSYNFETLAEDNSFPKETIHIIIDYLKSNLSFIIDKLKNATPAEMDDIKHIHFENTEIIKAIIDNRIETCYGNVKMSPVTEEFETLLCDALDNHQYYRINSISPKILSKCAETHQLPAIIHTIDLENQEQVEIILTALENGDITYSNLGYTFTAKYEKESRVIKAAIQNCYFYSVKTEDLLREDIIPILEAEINNNPETANNYTIQGLLEENHDIVYTILKNLNPENLTQLFNWYTPKVKNLLTRNVKKFSEAIIFALQKNSSLIPEIYNELFDRILANNPDLEQLVYEDKTLVSFFFTRIPSEKIIKTILTMKYDNDTNRDIVYIKDYIFEAIKDLDIVFNELPRDFNFTVNYPLNIWQSIIKIMTTEQLDPNKISLDQFKTNPEVFDLIIARLIELKSNKFNWTLEYWDGPITENFLKAIISKENPLNLSSSQKITISTSTKLIHTDNLSKAMDNMEEFDARCVQILTSRIFKDEETYRNAMKKLFDPKKLKMDQDLVDVLSSITEKAIQNPKNEIFPIFREYMVSYLEAFNHIPIVLTSLLDETTRAKCTYNEDDLLERPELFIDNNGNTHYPKDFNTFVDNAIEKQLPISFEVLYQIYRITNNTKYFAYDNITFNFLRRDEEIKKITMLFASYNNEDIKCTIDKWLKENLDGFLLESKNDTKNSQLYQYIFNTPVAIETLLEQFEVYIIPPIKESPIANSQKYTNKLTRLLILGDNINPEIKKKIEEYVYIMIENNSFVGFEAGKYIDEYLKINDPRFIKYVQTAITQNQNTYLNYLEKFLDNEHYHDHIIEIINVEDQKVLRLVDKYPEIKAKIITYLSTNKSGYISYHDEYKDPEILKAYLTNRRIDEVITHIVHNVTHEHLETYNPEFFKIVKEKFLENSQTIYRESFDILEKLYGYELYKMLQTETIIKLLATEPEQVRKFAEIFKPRQLDESIITSINDSFRQNLFSLNNPNIINFYTNTLEKIQRGITEEEIKEIITTLLPVIPNNLEELIIETENDYLLTLYQTNKEEFLKQLIMELGNNQNIYARLFNKITNNLIVQKRNEYRKSQNIYKDTALPHELETKSLYNALFNYIVKNDNNEITRFLNRSENYELDSYTILFLRGEQEDIPTEIIPKIKRNIKVIKDYFFKRFEQLAEPSMRNYNWGYEEPQKFKNLPRQYEFLLDDPEFMKSVRILPIYPKRPHYTETIGNLNLQTILTYIEDEDKYNALIDLLNKYRFLEWQQIFNPTIKSLSIGEDSNNIYNFINAFSKVYDNEMRIAKRERKRLIEYVEAEMRAAGKSESEIQEYKNLKEQEPLHISITAYKILKYGTIYSSISNSYKIILGLEDFELVKRNDGPNSSYRDQESRLQKASELQIKMMELDEITIPSFIHEHHIDEKKKLGIIIGNRADSRNLTHGERTGACMRAYGHANDLFEFCNTDPRGFHFTFIDPKTNEYVSRVSGFRNGNTVFLNQLRNSVNPKYSNEEVINACKSAAEELIARSKDSEMPIENVVASPFYALSGFETQQLSEYNIGEGVYNGYKDVSNHAVVLATTGANGEAVPLKLNGTDQPIYKPVRLPAKEYHQEEITENTKVSIQRIVALKECIANKEIPEYYKGIDFDYDILNAEYIHIVIGQDWYAAIDIYGNITYEIAVQYELSQNELQSALDKLNRIKEEQIKLGGFGNGLI